MKSARWPFRIDPARPPRWRIVNPDAALAAAPIALDERKFRKMALETHNSCG